MISVVIPLFNKEQFIAQTVQSVLDQEFDQFEILVVDDGSTDASLDVLETFNDPRLTVITQKNSGVSVARNTGLLKARFDWIGFLDADDWWSPQFLKEIMQAIRNHPREKIFASGRTLIFSNGEKRYAHDYLPGDGETGIQSYFRVIAKHLPMVNSSNSVISKELIVERGGFRVGQTQHEDHDLWLRLAADHQVVFVNKPLSFYRKTTAGSASQRAYSAVDFDTYLDTLLLIKSQLKGEELSYFQQYLDNFVFLTYLKNYWNYKGAQRRELLGKSKRLVNGGKGSLLSLTQLLPFNLYPILKALR